MQNPTSRECESLLFPIHPFRVIHTGQPQNVRSMWLLYVCCCIYRVANALAIRTAFSPDEYWQSLEVAHRLVFG